MRLFPRALFSILLVLPLALVAWTPDRSSDDSLLPVSAAAAPACSDVLLLGVDGAAEAPAKGNGFGPVLATASKRFRVVAAESGRSLQVQRMGPRFRGTRALLKAVDQTASRKAVTPARMRTWRGAAFPAIVTNVVTRVKQAVADCPRRQVVLAGYSQGAMVAHRALLRLGSSNAFPMVVGAVLVGDGDRVARSAANVIGNPAAAKTSRGQSAHVATAVADVPVAGSAKRVVSVCSAGDLLCDVGTTPARRALAVHNAYGKGAPTVSVRKAVNQVWLHARAWPKLPAKEPVVPAEVDRNLVRQLPVDIAPARAGDVVWEKAAGLPPGVTLNAKGRLSGVPEKVGNWKVTFTVRNAQLGTPAVSGSATVAVASSEKVLSSGGMASCNVRPNGSLWCWGDNSFGQVGDGTRTTRSAPVRVGTDADWESVSSGGSTSCGIRTDGTLWCWGLNNKGQLGLGDKRGVQLTPARVGAWSDWDQISTGWFHTCGIRDEGTAWCWGTNDRGQLGQNSRIGRIKPMQVGTNRQWETISVGGWHTCGTLRTGTGWCWGAAGFGQIGDGVVQRNRLVPRKVSGNQSWVRLSASWSSSCGLTESGQAWCWGLNNQGQLGSGNLADSATPVRVEGPGQLKTITLGNAHACGLEPSGDVWCWGANRYGQFGDGSNVSRLKATRVMQGSPWLAVSTGWFHTCALNAKREVKCWGNNEEGQLKRGNRDDSSSPPPAATATALRGAPTTKVTTFNILGSNHTAPGGGAANYAPGRIRAEWAADLILEYGSSIVGFQEIQADQLRAMLKIMGNRYVAFPGLNRGARAVWTTMMWDPSIWQMQSQETYKIPFLTAERPQPIVKLVHKVSGRKVAVLNVHNVSRKDPERVRQRAAELKIEIAQIKRLRNEGWDVIFMGDLNDREITFCRVTRETDLQAVQGGSNNNGNCTMPKETRLDWMFVSPGISRGAVNFDMREERGRVTDHSTLTGVLGVG